MSSDCSWPDTTRFPRGTRSRRSWSSGCCWRASAQRARAGRRRSRSRRAGSRIAVGAHWPSDALAGTGLGLLAGVAGTQMSLRWRLGSRPVAQALLALVVLVCAVILAWIDTGYPLAWPLQLALAAVGVAVAAIVLWRIWAARGHAARIAG